MTKDRSSASGRERRDDEPGRAELIAEVVIWGIFIGGAAYLALWTAPIMLLYWLLLFFAICVFAYDDWQDRNETLK